MTPFRSRIHRTAIFLLSILSVGVSGGDGGKNDRKPNKKPNKKPDNNKGSLPDFVGLDTLFAPNRIDDDRSHGIVFDIETAPSAKALRITHVEFYSDDDDDARGTRLVDYQICTKEGTWHDSDNRRDYTPLSSGNMTLDYAATDGGGYGRHKIPLTTKIKLDGNGTRISLYLGLSERIMLFQRPIGTGNYTLVSEDEEDTIPLLITDDMTLYAGAAMMIYPLTKASHPVYYRKPFGFVGRIWYERDACMPSVSSWDECPALSNVTSVEAEDEEVNFGSVYYGGRDSDETGVVVGGDATPSMSPSPSLEDGNRVYLVITFGDAPEGKLMDAAAQSSFEQVLFDYYMSQDVLAINDVDLDSVKVWLQQFLLPEQNERQLQNNNNNNYNNNNGKDTTIAQYQVTTILTITQSSLPRLITRDLLENALKNNTTDFFTSLKLTPALTPYLQNTGYISSIQTIDELTNPPTLSPTYAPTIHVTEPIVARGPTSPTVIALILLVTIYTCSVLFSTCYIRRARNEMEHDRYKKKLLTSTTIEDDIRGSKADFDPKQEKGGGDRKKKTEAGKLLRSSMASMRSSMSGRGGPNAAELLRDDDKNDFDDDEDESHSWERTSSAENSDSGGSSSDDSDSDGLSIGIT